MGMILRIASSRIVGQGDSVGRSGDFSLNLSANSVMRGRLDARRTLKSLVADLRKNAEDEISWRQGEFIFDDLPLQEIARELSNSFGATIQIADTTLQNYRITARFRDGEDLATILSVLHNAGYFNYSQNNKQIIITAKPD